MLGGRWGRKVDKFYAMERTLVGGVVAVLPLTSVTARFPCGVAAAAMLNLLFLALEAVVSAAGGAAAGGAIASRAEGRKLLGWRAKAAFRGARLRVNC